MSSSSSEALHLIPVACANSTALLTSRQIVTVNTENPMLYLGDNDTTAIVDPNLSQQVIKVYSKGGKLWAFGCRDARGSATLNGLIFTEGVRRELRKGDVLVLICDDQKQEYIYKVGNPDDYRVVTAADGDGTDTTSEPRKQASTTSEASQPLETASAAVAASVPQQPFPTQVSEQTMCAICFEIMWEPKTVIPCGHSFCKTCLEQQQTECAECRGPIHGNVTCLSLQNLIGDLVEVAATKEIPIFDKDDLESYQNRKHKATSTPAAVASNAPVVSAAVLHARKRRRMMRRSLQAQGNSIDNVIDLG